MLSPYKVTTCRPGDVYLSELLERLHLLNSFFTRATIGFERMDSLPNEQSLF